MGYKSSLVLTKVDKFLQLEVEYFVLDQNYLKGMKKDVKMLIYRLTCLKNDWSTVKTFSHNSKLNGLILA